MTDKQRRRLENVIIAMFFTLLGSVALAALLGVYALANLVF